MGRTAVADRLTGMVALSSGDDRADTLMRLICARTLALPPLPLPVEVPTENTDAESVLVAFAEQFSTDVTGIGDNQRTRFLETWGADADLVPGHPDRRDLPGRRDHPGRCLG